MFPHATHCFRDRHGFDNERRQHVVRTIRYSSGECATFVSMSTAARRIFFFPRAIYSSPEKRRCSERKKHNCDTQVRGSLCRVCDVRCHQTNNSGLFFSSLQSMDTNVRAAPKQQQSMQASDAHAPIAADCVPLSRACRRNAETRAAVQPVVYDEDNARAQYTTFSPKL